MPESAPVPARFEFKKDKVTVLKEEAVGMYEVAVLEAGSPAALKRWMDKHGYQYPKGMDTVTADYVESGWCFVAVKTKVGDKAGVDPKPGQRKTAGDRPAGSIFDGHVQGIPFQNRRIRCSDAVKCFQRWRHTQRCLHPFRLTTQNSLDS